NAKYPPDLARAQAFWKSENQRRLSAEDMRGASPLAAALPWLSMGDDERRRSEAGLARVRHNHWVIRRIEQKIQDHSSNPERLREWVSGQVEAYLRASAHPAWQRAVQAAFRV